MKLGHPSIRALGVGLLLCVATAALAQDPVGGAVGEVVEDDWYAVYVKGVKSGHARSLVRRGVEAGQPVWISESETHLTITRQGEVVPLDISERVIEDGAGRVLRFRRTQKMSASDLVTQGVLRGSQMHLDQNGVTRDVPYPPGALGPVAVDRLLSAQAAQEGARVVARTFSTHLPEAASEQTFHIEAKESKRVLDRSLRLSRCRVSTRGSTRSFLMWLDATGRMQVSETDVAGVGQMRMVLAPQKLATAHTRPTEIFSDSLVEPDRGIAAPRATQRGTYRLRRTAGALGTILSEGGQTVVRGAVAGTGADVAEVTVSHWAPPAGFRPARLPLRFEGVERYLARSAYLDTADDEVRRLAAAAIADETDALRCARRIEAYVRGAVDQTRLDVGFATASEVARNREGDCTENAVLAAALARAGGLPSRVVVGLVFVPGLSAPGVGPRGAFGYHMWAEVLVARDVWFPIDPALGTFDATHIALAKSDMATTDPVADLVLPLLDVIDTLEIEVLSVSR